MKHFVQLSGTMGPIFAAVAVDADQCFTLTLLDADKGYELQVTQEKITTLSSQLKVPELKTWAEETFIQGSKLFTCIIQDSKLEWKKSPEGHRKISLNLGSFDLKEISLNQAQQLVLSTASTNINALLEENNVTKTQLERTTEAYKEQQKAMNEMVSDKNKLEKDLFGQFIPILQSKHDKIQALEDEIGRLRASGSSESKEKDDDYGSDTDMDDEPVQQNDSLNILGI